MKALLITIVMALFVISCTTGTSEIEQDTRCNNGCPIEEDTGGVGEPVDTSAPAVNELVDALRDSAVGDSSLTCGTGVAQTIYGNMFYQCCREWWVGDSFYRYCCGFALSSGAGYGHGPVTCGPNYIFRG